ncbi:MAG TPA: aspartyl protease family protein [Caulobacteraceae bacterium]|jgi:hypothetical protein
MIPFPPHRRALLALLAAGVAAPAWAQGDGTGAIRIKPGASLLPDAGPDYTPPTDLSTIADIYHRMTTAVRVNGAGPFPFVVDTGANQSVIADNVAAQLGLAIGEPQPLNSVAGVSLAPVTRATLQASRRPPNEATLSVLPAKALGGAGILGLDQLDGSRVTLDFRRQVVVLDAPVELPGAGNEVSLGAQRRDGQLTLVNADVAGVRVIAFLDSGAQDTVGNMALRTLAVQRQPTLPWSQKPLVSVTGQTVICDFAELPLLRIGHLTMANWPIAFADLHVFEMWDMIEQPAMLLGVDVLSRFETICLDFARDEVRLRLPTAGWG